MPLHWELLSNTCVVLHFKAAFTVYLSTHSHTHGGGKHAKPQPAHWEHLGVKYLAQREFDKQAGRIVNQTGRQEPGTFQLLEITLTGTWTVHFFSSPLHLSSKNA